MQVSMEVFIADFFKLFEFFVEDFIFVGHLGLIHLKGFPYS